MAAFLVALAARLDLIWHFYLRSRSTSVQAEREIRPKGGSGQIRGCGQQIVDMSINKTKFAIGDNCPGKVDVAVAVAVVVEIY